MPQNGGPPGLRCFPCLNGGLTPDRAKRRGKIVENKYFIEIALEPIFCLKEINDLHILAKTAIANIPALVTSDGPLLNADLVGLQIAFQDAGLPNVSAGSPWPHDSSTPLEARPPAHSALASDLRPPSSSPVFSIEIRSFARTPSLLPSQLYLLCRSSHSLHSNFYFLISNF